MLFKFYFYNDSIAITRKGGDEDIVYFGPEVNDALLDHINNGRSVLEANDNDKDALFISSKHNRISVRNVETMIKKYAKRAGLNIKVTPHTLRRTYGTTLYEETNDIYLVSSSLNHKSIAVTTRFYTNMDEKHKKSAAEVASTLFKK